MSMSREYIQKLLESVDIVILINDLYPLNNKSDDNYFACCPFHTEKSASFSVSHSKQFYYCFGCGAHGNAINFLMQYKKLSYEKAIELLDENIKAGIYAESRKPSKPKGTH